MLPWSEKFSRSSDQMRLVRIKSRFSNRRIQGPVLRDKIRFLRLSVFEADLYSRYPSKIESRLIRTNCQSLTLFLIKK
jgi:hypothetical protein